MEHENENLDNKCIWCGLRLVTNWLEWEGKIFCSNRHISMWRDTQSKKKSTKHYK